MRTYNAHETDRMRQVHGAQLASFKARLLAFGIDFMTTVLICLLVVALGANLLSRAGLLNNDKHIDLEFDLHHWYSLIFVVLYFGLFTYLGNGQTLGKRLLGIRVVSLVDEKMSLWQSFERALGYGASALELGFGFIQYFVHPNRRTVHDRIAETIVIKENRKRSMAARESQHPNSFEATATEHTL